MYESYCCENIWKENDGGTDNNPKPDLDNIYGQITILNQILIISMYIASLVKRPYLLSYRLEMKIWACLWQITPSKFDEICPLAIPNQISLMSMHTASSVKIPCYLLKLSSENENMGMSRADNSIKN